MRYRIVNITSRLNNHTLDRVYYFELKTENGRRLAVCYSEGTAVFSKTWYPILCAFNSLTKDQKAIELYDTKLLPDGTMDPDFKVEIVDLPWEAPVAEPLTPGPAPAERHRKDWHD